MQRPDVAIVMARGHPTSQPQIANAFENSGASARVVDDGDPSGLSAGLLVLPGSSRAYLHYPRILRTLGPRRPRVAPKKPFYDADFSGARFIWTKDLDLDNTVIFRYRVEKPDWKPRWNTKPDLDVSGATPWRSVK